jgi:glycosyltransferase involved in cell wall biosynthesis
MAKVSKKPLISVIVPVYKVERYLNECVDSIINQTYKNLEIILVDDGSPDNCPAICDEYAKIDKRIKVIHKQNDGVSSARNAGIDIAKGEYISFVDSDDYVDKEYINVMYLTAISNNVEYVCCGYKRVYNNTETKINGDSSLIIIEKEDYIKQVLNVQNGYGFCHMKLIKRTLLDNIRFNERIEVGEDALFNIQLCFNIKKVAILKKCLYYYRFNSNSVVRKYDDNYIYKYKLSMDLMDNIIRTYFFNKNEIIKCLYNYISYHVLLISVNYCYHPSNPNNKYRSLVEMCNIPIFNESIKNSTYENLSITRKIALFSIKKRLFFLTDIICRIRQFQFMNGGE